MWVDKCAQQQCAAQPAPQNSSSSPFPLSDTLTRENPPGEEASSEWRATEGRCPKPWRPLDAQEDLQEAEGVPSVPSDPPTFLEDIDPFEIAGVAENADGRKVGPSGVDAHGRGEALPAPSAAPVSTENSAGIEPASATERVTAAKIEALEPRTESEAGRKRRTPSKGHKTRPGEEVEKSRKGKGERTEALPQSNRDALPRSRRAAAGEPKRGRTRARLVAARRGARGRSDDSRGSRPLGSGKGADWGANPRFEKAC